MIILLYFFATFAEISLNYRAMVIMYLTFGGRTDISVQAYFSILSFYRQLGKDDSIVMVTTTPEYYKRMPFVNIITINDKKIEEWKGKHHFFWRTKIKAIEMVAQKYKDSDLLYVDCDTFLYGDFNKLKDNLANCQGLMDVDDGHPKFRKFKPRRMWKKIGGNTYNGITLGMQHNMWIAGVLGIPRERKESVIQTALNLCDEILDDKPEDIVVEQYALSVAMYEKSSLKSTQDIIGHYWSNKEDWINLINAFIIKSYMSNATIEDDIDRFQTLPLAEIPIYNKQHNTPRRLNKLLNKLFKPRNHVFINRNMIK